MFSQHLSIGEIAEQRGLTERTVFNHLERLVSAGEKLDLAHVIPSLERLAKIEAAFQECGSQFLAPVKDLLGEGFSYEELTLIRIHLRQKQEAAPQDRITRIT